MDEQKENQHWYDSPSWKSIVAIVGLVGTVFGILNAIPSLKSNYFNEATTQPSTVVQKIPTSTIAPTSPIATSSPTQAPKVLYPKGTIIPFGTYNGYSLTWRILDVSDNKYLLLSEGGVSNRGFHTSNDSTVTWNTCSLRSWLNNDFYNAAFQPADRKAIQDTRVDGENSKLYLLSRDETEKYMKTDSERKCYPSSNLDVFREPRENGAGWWMLRTPAKNAATVITINADGKFDYNEGCSLINVHNRGVVRPAMWVSADYFG